MNAWPKLPVVYEINTWVWLHHLSQATRQPITLANVPQPVLESLAGLGFDAIWLMGVWRRSPLGRQTAANDHSLHAEYSRALSDFDAQDIVGSPYSITDYEVDAHLGGDQELAILRRRLHELGLRLILDFVPNHMGIGHVWQRDHPGRLVQGTRDELNKNPTRYYLDGTGPEPRIFAYGRALDRHVWPDTVQIDYRRAETREAMGEMVKRLAQRCDGVRCDMAMLVTRDLFLQTWGGQFDRPEAEFWPEVIQELKQQHPEFLMIAEVYGWGMNLEYKLQQQRFDYTYDKVLYDRLVDRNVPALLDHLRGGHIDFQRRLARFVENHDEERAAARVANGAQQAVALIALTVPGLRLIHEGQMEGFKVKLPVHLRRRPEETPDPELQAFYAKLLAALRDPVFHEGHWQLLDAWDASQAAAHNQAFLAYLWQHGEERRLVVANLSAKPMQCIVSLAGSVTAGSYWQLRDRLGDADLIYPGSQLNQSGLSLAMPGHSCHLFQIEKAVDFAKSNMNSDCIS